MDRNQECRKLAARFDDMAAAGLVDVKFYVRNPDEALTESACREVNRLFEAVDRGEAEGLEFKNG